MSGKSVPSVQLWLGSSEYSEPWLSLSHSLGSLSQAGRMAANSILWLSQLGDLGTQRWLGWQTGTREGVRDWDRWGSEGHYTRQDFHKVVTRGTQSLSRVPSCPIQTSPQKARAKFTVPLREVPGVSWKCILWSPQTP